MSRRAVVVGGGFAGLVAAQALTESFDSVLLVDKDPRLGCASLRAGLPQAAHLHVLLARGQELLQDFFPGILEEFARAGCPKIDWAADTLWEGADGAFPVHASKVETLSFSRSFLDSQLVSRLKTNERLAVREGVAWKADFSGREIAALELLDGGRLEADLFVFAGGAAFPLVRFLGGADLAPITEQVDVRITYHSAFFPLRELDFPACRQYYYQLEPPREKLGGVICPVEDGKAVATLVEYDSPRKTPISAEEFFALAGKVPGGRFARILAEARPVTSVKTFYKPVMHKRAIHRLASVPKNMILLGDTVCSLNPVFGQGLTAALLQAEELRHWAAAGKRDSRIFHRNAHRRLLQPFLLSKLGSRSRDNFPGRCLDAALEISRTDPAFHRRFLKVLHLQESGLALVQPRLLSRALLGGKNA
jgi:2-polyprenyl-6-methoxyphenol hydroxylase-like FAD-dependent oxidoreductase